MESIPLAFIEHVLVAVIAGVPATIAAVSSTRNHRELRETIAEVKKNRELILNGGRRGLDLDETETKADWYKPPDLN